MPEDKQQQNKEKEGAGIHLDLGLGGIFKGLGDLLDVLSDMSESGEEEVTRTGEFKVKGLGEKGRGVYGVSIRTGIGGIPQVQRFGNIRSSKEGAVVADVREPLVDVFEEEQEIVLPGAVDGASVKKSFKNGILELRMERA